MQRKKCSICHQIKPLRDFYRANHSGVRRADCKECQKQRVRSWQRQNSEYAGKYYENNKEETKSRNRMYHRTINGRARHLWLKAKKRHDHSKGELIEFEDIKKRLEKGTCERSGVRLVLEPHAACRRHPFAPSLDQKTPKGGYTSENVNLVCNIYNMGKNEFSEVEFEFFCRSFIAFIDEQKGD